MTLRRIPTTDLKNASEKTSEVVEILRDDSGMTHRDVVAISLRSGTQSIDNLIKKALKAVESTTSRTRKSMHQEWIQ